MVKCLWCLKELGIFGMLFHKAVCLEYLYSKSLDKLKQAKQSQLITKEQYLYEKRNLRQYFMSRFKPKVYEAFIKRQKEKQYILINPNELSISLESDIDVISKKVCVESQDISEKSSFLQSFQNQIDYDQNYIVKNYSENIEVQPINITNQLVDNNNNNNKNLENIHQYKDQYDNSQNQFIQLQQNIIQQQIRDNIKEKPQNVIHKNNEEQKENILFKLLQKRAKPKSQNKFNKSISHNQNIKQIHTRSKSRKIKEDQQQKDDTKAEINKSPIQQEELATEIKSLGITVFKTNKKKPPKFSQSLDKINSQINEQIEILSTKRLQRTNINKIKKTLNNQQNDSKEKPMQKGMIKTRFQSSLDKQTNTMNLKTRDLQKIKKK